MFTRIIIGSALREVSTDRRLRAYVDSVASARKAIQIGSISFWPTSTQDLAEQQAVDAVKIVGIPGSPAIYRRVIDLATTYGLPSLLRTAIAPWAASLTPVAQQAYRYNRGTSIGESIGRIIFDTKRRYLKLARSVPGRIERVLCPRI